MAILLFFRLIFSQLFVDFIMGLIFFVFFQKRKRKEIGDAKQSIHHLTTSLEFV
jgi:hypothetical protein